jgi:hypothetical protein
MNLNHILKKVGRGCKGFRNIHAQGYSKSVTVILYNTIVSTRSGCAATKYYLLSLDRHDLTWLSRGAPLYHQGITEEGGEGQGSAGVATTCTKSQSCETQPLLNTFYMLMVEQCVSYERPTTLLLLRRKQL